MSESFLEFLDAQQPEREESWQVQTDDEAMWCLRKIAAAEALVRERQAVAEREAQRLREWVEQAQREAGRQRSFMEAKLHGYLLRLQERGKLGTKKSWSLPNGRLQFRTVPARFEVVDEAAFLAWCEARGLTQVTIKPAWTEAKKHFDAFEEGVWEVDQQTGLMGEAVPGVACQPPRETFTVRLPDAP